MSHNLYVFFVSFFYLLNYTHFTVKMIFRISGDSSNKTYIYRHHNSKYYYFVTAPIMIRLILTYLFA